MQNPEINITLPTSWEEIDGNRLAEVLAMQATGLPAADVKILLALKWSGLSPVTMVETNFVVLKNGLQVRVPAVCLAGMVHTLDFLDTPPASPARPDTLRGYRAIDAALHGTPFGMYLQLSNYFRLYLQATAEVANNPEAAERAEPILRRAACILYEDMQDTEPLTQAEQLTVLHWLTGLFTMMAREHSHLYQGEGDADTAAATDMRESMLAQIRALTGGDITKEQAVLDADTWTALAELDAKAREAQKYR